MREVLLPEEEIFTIMMDVHSLKRQTPDIHLMVGLRGGILSQLIALTLSM